MNTIEYKDNEIIITGKRPLLIVRIILALIILLSFITPLIVIIMMLISNDKFSYGTIVGLLLFWIVGIKMSIVFIWNNFGREIISFTDDSILYTADYKFYKDKVRELSKNGLEYKVLKKDNNKVTFLFFNGQYFFETVLQVDESEVIALIDKIKS